MAKLYVDELCSGLNPGTFPKCTAFPMRDSSIVFQRDIPFTSVCMHHFLPFTGVAHVGYRSTGRIIGLSKLNRIVAYFAKRPQVQELFNKQVLSALQAILDTPDVYVKVEAVHSCIQMRGINQKGSTTVTQEASGSFKDPTIVDQYLHKL